jgi:hypothetical protein
LNDLFRTLPAASSYASIPDALTAVPAREKSPVQHEHYTHTAPDIPSSIINLLNLDIHQQWRANQVE